MTRQASKHASPGKKRSVLFLKKGGKHTPPEIRQLTGVPERTQRDWVAAAKLELNMRRAWKLLGREKELLANLCDSMQRRIAQLVEVEGGHTKY